MATMETTKLPEAALETAKDESEEEAEEGQDSTNAAFSSNDNEEDEVLASSSRRSGRRPVTEPAESFRFLRPERSGSDVGDNDEEFAGRRASSGSSSVAHSETNGLRPKALFVGLEAAAEEMAAATVAGGGGGAVSSTAMPSLPPSALSLRHRRIASEDWAIAEPRRRRATTMGEQRLRHLRFHFDSVPLKPQSNQSSVSETLVGQAMKTAGHLFSWAFALGFGFLFAYLLWGCLLKLWRGLSRAKRFQDSFEVDIDHDGLWSMQERGRGLLLWVFVGCTGLAFAKALLVLLYYARFGLKASQQRRRQAEMKNTSPFFITKTNSIVDQHMLEYLQSNYDSGPVTALVANPLSPDGDEGGLSPASAAFSMADDDDHNHHGDDDHDDQDLHSPKESREGSRRVRSGDFQSSESRAVSKSSNCSGKSRGRSQTTAAQMISSSTSSTRRSSLRQENTQKSAVEFASLSLEAAHATADSPSTTAPTTGTGSTFDGGASVAAAMAAVTSTSGDLDMDAIASYGAGRAATTVSSCGDLPLTLPALSLNGDGFGEASFANMASFQSGTGACCASMSAAAMPAQQTVTVKASPREQLKRMQQQQHQQHQHHHHHHQHRHREEHSSSPPPSGQHSGHKLLVPKRSGSSLTAGGPPTATLAPTTFGGTAPTVSAAEACNASQRRRSSKDPPFVGVAPVDWRSENGKKLQELVYKLADWNFDIFAVAERTPQPLCFVGFVCLDAYSKLVDFDKPKLLEFLRAVEGSYRGVAYHNSLHGASVARMVYSFCAGCGLAFTQEYMEFTLVLAGLVHDVHHPGLTPSFLSRASVNGEWNSPITAPLEAEDMELSLKYNDQSPLENMHCAITFDLLKQDRTGFLLKDEVIAMRKPLVRAILGTDMAKHAESMTRLAALIDNLDQDEHDATGVPWHWPAKPPATADEEQRAVWERLYQEEFVLELFLHAADIGNPTLPFDQWVRWNRLVQREFHDQGQRELLEFGELISLPAGFDINAPIKAEHGFTKGFMQHLTLPMFQKLHELTQVRCSRNVCQGVNVEGCLENLQQNLKLWDEYSPIRLGEEENLPSLMAVEESESDLGSNTDTDDDHDCDEKEDKLGGRIVAGSDGGEEKAASSA